MGKGPLGIRPRHHSTSSLELPLINFRTQPCGMKKNTIQTPILIGSIVAPYVDPSNPALHFDELIAECKAKLAQANTRWEAYTVPDTGQVLRLPEDRGTTRISRKTIWPILNGPSSKRSVWCSTRSSSRTNCRCGWPKPVVQNISVLERPCRGSQLGIWQQG